MVCAFESLRMAHSRIKNDAKKYLDIEPAPIDFEYYRSQLKSQDLVNAMEV